MRGLRTKLYDLSCSVSTSDYHIIVLTETNLSSDITDAELGMTDYVIFRRDRSLETSSKQSMGGVLIAIHKSISCQPLPTTVPVEQAYVAIGFARTQYIIGCVYLPPNSPVDRYLMVSDSIDSLSNAYPDARLYLMGDFNLPKAAWVDDDFCSAAILRGEAYVPPQSTEAIATISDMCSFHNLFQLNYLGNHNNNILDLVLSPVKFIVHSCNPLVRIDEHHPPLSFSFSTSSEICTTVRRANEFYYDFKSADYTLLNGYLCSFDWDTILSSVNVDDMLGAFYDIVYNALNVFVPLKKVASGKFPRWFSRDLINLTIQKKRAHKKYKSSGSYQNYQLFSGLRSQCSICSRECYRNYIQNIESSLQNDTKHFWNFINSKRKTNELPAAIKFDDACAEMGPEAANLFADYFGSVYSVPKQDCMSEILSNNIINISNYHILISDIYTELNGLKTDRGPGPDNIHPLFLKNCSFVLSRPLQIIFNESLKQGHFPGFWKTSFVVPIHKTGDKSDVRNYRPISILNVIPKIFEKLVSRYLTSTLSTVIIGEQFGFCPRKNTELNLLTYSHSVLEALEGGSEVHSVYTDFTKAFDRVPHTILLNKLRTLGISGPLLGWIRTYLLDRTQLVKANNFLSREVSVSSGVPQGSHVGPLLFNIFINDISDCFLSSKFLLFADDLKLFRTVVTSEDCQLLQDDLNRFTQWCHNNGMELNVSKCKLMKFSRLRHQINFNYLINGEILSSVANISDLGVTLDPALSYREHTSNIVSKSLMMLGFIKRNSKEFLTITSLKILYCSLVRARLEYASSVWNPLYANNVHRLERVQRKFLHYINFKFFNNDDFHYESLCRRLNLLPLSIRRRNRDLDNLFKILNSLSDCPDLLAEIGLYAPTRMTRNRYTFNVSFHRTNYVAHSFIPRSAALANRFADLNFFCTHKLFLSQLARLDGV